MWISYLVNPELLNFFQSPTLTRLAAVAVGLLLCIVIFNHMSDFIRGERWASFERQVRIFLVPLAADRLIQRAGQTPEFKIRQRVTNSIFLYCMSGVAAPLSLLFFLKSLFGGLTHMPALWAGDLLTCLVYMWAAVYCKRAADKERLINRQHPRS